MSTLSTMEALIFLKKVPLFSNFNLESLLGLKQITEETSYSPGEYIIREGESGSRAFIIVSGLVEVTKSINNSEKVLATLEKSAYFGEMAIIENEPRSASVRAKTDCLLLAIIGEGFREMIRTNAELAFELVKIFSRRTRDMMNK